MARVYKSPDSVLIMTIYDQADAANPAPESAFIRIDLDLGSSEGLEVIWYHAHGDILSELYKVQPEAVAVERFVSDLIGGKIRISLRWFPEDRSMDISLMEDFEDLEGGFRYLPPGSKCVVRTWNEVLARYPNEPGVQ